MGPEYQGLGHRTGLPFACREMVSMSSPPHPRTRCLPPQPLSCPRRHEPCKPGPGQAVGHAGPSRASDALLLTDLGTPRSGERLRVPQTSLGACNKPHGEKP